jgi:hypothetical protein
LPPAYRACALPRRCGVVRLQSTKRTKLIASEAVAPSVPYCGSIVGGYILLCEVLDRPPAWTLHLVVVI